MLLIRLLYMAGLLFEHNGCLIDPSQPVDFLPLYQPLVGSMEDPTTSSEYTFSISTCDV